MTDTFPKIAEILANRIATPPEKITLDARIGSDLGLRDEAATDFLMAVEDVYRICINHSVWLGINTLGDLIDVVDDLRAQERFAEPAPC